MGRRQVTAMGAALSVVTAAIALAARAHDTTVTLARIYTKGAVQSYKRVVKAKLSQMDVLVTETDKYTVKDIQPNGDVTLLFEPGKQTITAGDQNIDQPIGAPVQETYNRVGNLTGYENADKSVEPGPSFDAMHLNASMMTILLPTKPVKPNDEWTTDVIDPGDKVRKIHVKTTFVGTEKVEGADVWRFKQTADFTPAGRDARSTYALTATLRQSDGQMLSLNATCTGIYTPAGNVDTQVTITAKPAAGESVDKTVK